MKNIIESLSDNLKRILLQSLLVTFSIITTTNNAQVVDWRSVTWIDKDYGSAASGNTPTVDQRHSDYDWWYDHCNGNANQYIAAGVAKYRCAKRINTNLSENIYKEPAYNGVAEGCVEQESELLTGSYDYGNWENPITGNLGMTFNQIGKITDNLNGTTTLNYMITMNYGGEYYRVKKLHDGTYLTVGNCQGTRKGKDAPLTNNPTPGMPLLYNPTSTQSNDYFSKSTCFTGDFQNVVPAEYRPSHWDVMRFNGSDGSCIFNNIYGVHNFTGGANVNIHYNASSATLSANPQQVAYFSGGESTDFVQEPGTNGNIAVVGYCRDVNGYLQASIITMDINGYVIGKRFIATAYNLNNLARAVDYAVINGTPYYIVGVTATSLASSGGKTVVNIYKISTDLSTVSLLTAYTSQPAISNGDATTFSFSIKNNVLFIPLLINNTAVTFYSGPNNAQLRMIRFDLNTNSELSDEFLSQVQAFDLKARTTIFANGDIGVVSAKITQPWLSQYGTTCLTTVNSSGYKPCEYMFPPNNCASTDFAPNTAWWNSDTYVARINSATGTKIWETTFDAASPSGCNDFPTSTISGGGDPKHQECMYGISEAPDGGIVVSGNMSDNYDDNYMAKLSDCGSNANFTFTEYTQPASANIEMWTNNGGNPWGVLSNNNVRVLNELRISAGASVEAYEITFEFGPNGRLLLSPVLHLNYLDARSQQAAFATKCGRECAF